MSGVVAIQSSNMASNSIDSFLLQLAKRTTEMVDQNAGDASDDTLNIIDGLLRTTAANVRATLNARLPINLLPPEVLTLIFKMFRDPALLTSANSWHYEGRTHAIWDHEATDPQNLVIATHVCRHWRNVALANASLWDTLCCNRLGAAVGEFLERSGSVPLCVVEDDRDLGDAFLSTVPLLSARLRELHFVDLPAYMLYGIMSELQFPTPHLRMLTLGVRRTSGPRGHDVILFNGVTPCLERLSLFGLRWLPTNQFPNLTHLYLYNCCPVPIRLLSLLSRTPQLIDLVVSQENGRDREAALDDYPHTALLSFTTTGPPDEILKVSLPLLQRIVFRHASGILAHVLPGLIISDDAAIRIEDLTIRDSSDFLIIRNLLQPWEVLVFRVFVEYRYPDISIIAVGNSTGFSLRHLVSNEPDDWCATLPRILSLHKIVELWLLEEQQNRRFAYERRDRQDHSLRKVFRESSSLRKILLNARSLYTVVDILRSSEGASTLCPQLSSMHVLFSWRDDDMSALSVLADVQPQFPVRQLIVGFLPDYEGNRNPMGDLQHFESVEYVHHEEMPKMTMPPVCTTPAHILWPSWHELCHSAMDTFTNVDKHLGSCTSIRRRQYQSLYCFRPPFFDQGPRLSSKSYRSLQNLRFKAIGTPFLSSIPRVFRCPL